MLEGGGGERCKSRSPVKDANLGRARAGKPGRSADAQRHRVSPLNVSRLANTVHPGSGFWWASSPIGRCLDHISPSYDVPQSRAFATDPKKLQIAPFEIHRFMGTTEARDIPLKKIAFSPGSTVLRHFPEWRGLRRRTFRHCQLVLTPIHLWSRKLIGPCTIPYSVPSGFRNPRLRSDYGFRTEWRRSSGGH